jgi:hypothetical protein
MKHKTEHISKAQLEVWEWKQKAYEQIKDMPLDKGIEFIMQQTRELANEISKAREKEKPLSQ